MISLEKLSIYSSRILALLEYTSSVSDLTELLDSEILFERNEFIQVERRPSINLKFCYAISYIIKGKGVPIEARINEDERYIVLFCKSVNKVKGYEPFRKDLFGNYLYSKTIKSIEITDLKSELKRLVI